MLKGTDITQFPEIKGNQPLKPYLKTSENSSLLRDPAEQTCCNSRKTGWTNEN